MNIANSAVHGVFMSVLDTGVLLIGESGVGKSDLALSLLDRGHLLVADDVVEFSFSNGCLVGRAPKLLRNFLHVRNFGVLDVTAHFGEAAVLTEKKLSLVVQLERSPLLSHNMTFNSTPWSLLDVAVPSFHLSVSANRPREVLLEALIRNSQLLQQGHDANSDFIESHHQVLSATV